MNGLADDRVAAFLNALEFVTWDRAIRDPAELVAYGWIDRDDAYKDFVVVMFTPDGGVGYTTSSARYSEEIGRVFYGSQSEHLDCERITDVNPLVTRVVQSAALAES